MEDLREKCQIITDSWISDWNISDHYPSFHYDPINPQPKFPVRLDMSGARRSWAIWASDTLLHAQVILSITDVTVYHCIPSGKRPIYRWM